MTVNSAAKGDRGAILHHLITGRTGIDGEMAGLLHVSPSQVPTGVRRKEQLGDTVDLEPRIYHVISDQKTIKNS
jgi:hypothetical protein